MFSKISTLEQYIDENIDLLMTALLLPKGRKRYTALRHVTEAG